MARSTSLVQRLPWWAFIILGGVAYFALSSVELFTASSRVEEGFLRVSAFTIIEGLFFTILEGRCPDALSRTTTLLFRTALTPPHVIEQIRLFAAQLLLKLNLMMCNERICDHAQYPDHVYDIVVGQHRQVDDHLSGIGSSVFSCQCQARFRDFDLGGSNTRRYSASSSRVISSFAATANSSAAMVLSTR